MATHLERLQAAIVTRVFFNEALCYDSERVCNTWMAAWDCFHEFRLSSFNPRPAETALTRIYIGWYLEHAYRSDISASSNLDRLTLNVEMLETLSPEIQNEIIKHVHIPANTNQDTVPQECKLQQQT